jgi:uncharacterized membrane protein YozB (DUF420 family)
MLPKNLFTYNFDMVSERSMFSLGLGLGHPRLLHTDLNLLIQIVTLVIIFVSLYYKKKGKIKPHATIMATAFVLHLLSFILVMGPAFIQSFDFYASRLDFLGVQTAWVHAIPGSLALTLGAYLVLVWAVKAKDVAPCYNRKKIMDVTIALWMFSLLFGILTYILFYG